MKFTVSMPGLSLYPGIAKHWWEHITTDELQRIARATDELGYEYLGIPTHLFMTSKTVGEMGSRWVHSLSAAGFVLGATKRIKVNCFVCVPYHNPIELAKAFGTLDYMSGGRVIIQALLGYNRDEFEAVRVPYEQRGEIMDEYMDAMIELWSSPNPVYRGKHVSFDDIVFDPKPVQQPFPIWIGGRTNAALRRIARIGDAWMSYATPRAQLREKVEYIRAQPEFIARPRPLDLFAYLFEGKRDPVTHEVLEQPRASIEKEEILAEIQALADVGVTMTDAGSALGTGVFQNDLPGSPPPTRSADDYIERLHWFAEELMPDAGRITPGTP
jgi:probable F420-dependent oxidoreductase